MKFEEISSYRSWDIATTEAVKLTEYQRPLSEYMHQNVIKNSTFQGLIENEVWRNSVESFWVIATTETSNHAALQRPLG